MVAGIKATFAQKIAILRVNDIMAYSWLSGDDVVSNIFANEDSFDDSDSESGDDIYGYLGAFAVSRDELVEESRILAVDEFEADELSSEDERSNNEELLNTCSESDSEQTNQSGMEDDSRYEDDGSGSIVPDPGRLSEHNDEANDIDEVVSDVT